MTFYSKIFIAVLGSIGYVGSMNFSVHASTHHDLAFKKIQETIGYTIEPVKNSFLLPVLKDKGEIYEKSFILKGNKQKTIEVIGFTNKEVIKGMPFLEAITTSLYPANNTITFDIQFPGISCGEVTYTSSKQSDYICLQDIGENNWIVYHVQLPLGKWHNNIMSYEIKDFYYQIMQPVYEYLYKEGNGSIEYFIDFLDEQGVNVIQSEEVTTCELTTSHFFEGDDLMGIDYNLTDAGMIITHIFKQSNLYFLRHKLPLLVTHINENSINSEFSMSDFLYDKSSVELTIYDIEQKKLIKVRSQLKDLYHTREQWICPPFSGNNDFIFINNAVEKLFNGYVEGKYSYTVLENSFRHLILQHAKRNNGKNLLYATNLRNNLSALIQQRYFNTVKDLISGELFDKELIKNYKSITSLSDRLTKLEKLIDDGTYEDAKQYFDTFPPESWREYIQPNTEPVSGINNLLEDLFPGQGPTGVYQDHYQVITDALAHKRYIENSEKVLKNKNGAKVIATLSTSDDPTDMQYAARLFLEYNYQQEDTDDYYIAVKNIFQKVITYHFGGDIEAYIQKVLTRDDKENFLHISKILDEASQPRGNRYLSQILLRTQYTPAVDFIINRLSTEALQGSHSDLFELSYINESFRNEDTFDIVYKLLHKISYTNLLPVIRKVKPVMTKNQKEKFIKKLLSPEESKETLQIRGYREFSFMLNNFEEEKLVKDYIKSLLTTGSINQKCGYVTTRIEDELVKPYIKDCKNELFRSYRIKSMTEEVFDDKSELSMLSTSYLYENTNTLPEVIGSYTIILNDKKYIYYILKVHTQNEKSIYSVAREEIDGIYRWNGSLGVRYDGLDHDNTYYIDLLGLSGGTFEE